MTDLPLIGVGAVVWKGADVLLIKRARPPFEGHWSIPGGKLEFGEPLAAGLAREVREETGVEIALLGLIDVAESIRAPDYHYVMVDYAARWTAGEVRAGDDAAAAQWFSYEAGLKALSWDKTRQVLTASRRFLDKG